MTPTVERHFYRMALDLTHGTIDGPALPAAHSLEPMTLESLASYGRIAARSYAGDHVDHQPDDDDPSLAAKVIEAALRGDELGPWIPHASAHIRHDDGAIIAAIVISDRPPTGEAEPDKPDAGGPWINDVFVDPAAAGQGLGAALIVNAANQLITFDHTHLRLAVTHGNPAIDVYERLGFRVEHETRRF